MCRTEIFIFSVYVSTAYYTNGETHTLLYRSANSATIRMAMWTYFWKLSPELGKNACTLFVSVPFQSYIQLYIHKCLFAGIWMASFVANSFWILGPQTVWGHVIVWTYTTVGRICAFSCPCRRFTHNLEEIYGVVFHCWLRNWS